MTESQDKVLVDVQIEVSDVKKSCRNGNSGGRWGFRG
jgi:hypothetical protein